MTRLDWKTILTTALLGAVTLSGCLAGDESESLDDADTQADKQAFDAEWADKALPFDQDHDHRDAAQHEGLSTHNFDLLGWDPLISDWYGGTSGGHLCGDAKDAGEMRLGAVHGYQTDVAFVLVDVTDPAAPTPLGEFISPYAGSRDVAVAPSGKHVVFASTGPKQPDKEDGLSAAGSGLYWRSACTGQTSPVPILDPNAEDPAGPLPPGAILVNVEDPDNMFVESIFATPSPLGVHSIYAGETGGIDFVIVGVVNLVAFASNFYFLAIEETTLGSHLVYLSEYQDKPTDGNGAIINGHNDGVMQVHPVTGQTLAYLANWHQGMVILDMTNPRLPEFLGRWTDNDGPTTALVQDGIGNYHEAIPIDTTWDGRHYTLVGQEILSHPANTASGWLHVVDTTDPTNPVRVSSWTLPVDVQWDESLVFSTHYVSYFEKTAFMAHYHAGVWAIDLTGVGTEEILPAIGVFVPANVSPQPPSDGNYDWTPTIMDANVLANGDQIIWDNTSGVYVTHFDADNPAPPRYFTGLGA